jgi:hypothetical protein
VAELEDALDALGKPDPNDPKKIIRSDAVTVAELAAKAPGAEWLNDGKKSRVISRRLREAGYVRVHNPDAPGGNGLWVIKGKRVGIFARRRLTLAAQLLAARQLKFRIEGPTVAGGTTSSSSSKKADAGTGAKT